MPDPPRIHPTAVIDEPSDIGEGTRIWHFCHIMPSAHIGRECILGQNCFVATGATIGDRVKIQNNVSVYKGCVIEDDVFLGPSCVLTNVTNPRAHIERKSEFEETRIKRGATIGANATVVCGVTIGKHALVGAGAAVTRDVPDHGLVLGVPARLVGYVCQCGVTLSKLGPDGLMESAAKAVNDPTVLTCHSCRTEYLLENRSVRPMRE